VKILGLGNLQALARALLSMEPTEQG
jgi:hypothetical protein